MTFKTYKTPTEARAAFMAAVNQRKVWEAEMRKRMEAMGILESSVLEPEL